MGGAAAGALAVRLLLGRLRGPVHSGVVRRASGLAVSEEAAANLSPPAAPEAASAEPASRPAASARPSAGCARPPRLSLGLRREPPNWLDGPFLLRTRPRRRGSAAGPPRSPEVRPRTLGLPGRGPLSLPLPRVPGRRICDLARAARLLLGVWHRALWRGDRSSLFLLRRGIYQKGTGAL